MTRFEKVYQFSVHPKSWLEQWIDKKCAQINTTQELLQLQSLWLNSAKARRAYDFEIFADLGLGRPHSAPEHYDMEEAVELVLFRASSKLEKRIAWNLNFEEDRFGVNLVFSSGHTTPLSYKLIKKVN